MPIETDGKTCRGRHGDQPRPRERTPPLGPTPSEEQAFPDYPHGVCAAPRPTRLDANDFRMSLECVPCRPSQSVNVAMRDNLEELEHAMSLLSGKLEGHRKIRLTLGYLGEDVCTEPPTEPNGKDAVADCHERSPCDVSPDTVADPSSDRGSLPPKLRGRS